jgi:Tol biopolymer transport system component
VVRLFLSALVFICAVVSLAALGERSALAANDPRLDWKTIETPRFRITYYSGEEEIARHLANRIEAIHARLSPVLGWAPKEKVEIALFDQTDGANGFTSGIPYNAIRLFVTAPDDLSPLSDVDDWYEDLVTHEYTHTLHIDSVRGLPALVNVVMGRTLIPNQWQPRWVLEGLAVYEESMRTSAGRLRSSQWDMYMRTDVLENNVATLDQFSHTPRRWPQGNLWYLYGSFFIKWIQDQYGEVAVRRIIEDTSRQLIPLGINRSVRRAVGKTYEELYPEWVLWMQQHYAAEAAAITARGIRQGVRVTTGGNTAQHPMWIPDNAWPEHKGGLVYFRDDSRTTPGIYAVDLVRDPGGALLSVNEKGRELVARTNGTSNPTFAPDGSMIFDSQAPYRRIFTFGDLFSLGPGERSASGLDASYKRLTEGFRAGDPSVSPDGRHVVFTTNHRGTRYLQIADIGPEGIKNVHSLVQSYRFEQAFVPKWSPDNRHVAYSVWTEGGYRDIRYVDTWDGSYVEVMHDRAIDGGPSFSPDGRRIFFHSDRTGVMNVYAWEVATGALKQVTNVLTGAYQPVVSPDGKTLAYLGYTHAGFDLYAMALRESDWLSAPPYVDRRPSPNPVPPEHAYPIRPYNPLETLRPRRYSVQVTPGNYGQAVIVNTDGNDIAGLHSFAASMTTELEKPAPQFGLSYNYGRLPVDVGFYVYRTVAPRGGYQLGTNYKPAWLQEAIGASTGLSYSIPGVNGFDGQSMDLNYSVQRLGGDLPAPITRYDPYETPSIPQRGFLADLHLGWGYSNTQRFLWSIGPEKGFSLGANFDFTNPAIASEYTGFAAKVDFSTYLLMPWLRHHSLGLHGSAGTSDGNFPGRGPYYVGGFVDLPLYDTVRNILIQGGIVLRGYPTVALTGRSFALANAEYRFPIVNIDRGLSTLPVFFQRVSGAVFVDYGSAFNDPRDAKFKTGVGGELWFDSTVAYVVGFTFRLGFAKGLASGGIDKLYFVAAVPF